MTKGTYLYVTKAFSGGNLVKTSGIGKMYISPQTVNLQSAPSLGDAFGSSDNTLYTDQSSQPVTMAYNQSSFYVQNELGVGTDNPSFSLGVDAGGDRPVARFSSSEHPRVVINATTTNQNSSYVMSGPNQEWRFEKIGDSFWNIKDATAGTYPFRVYTGAPTNSLTVASSGNVGIGTSSPSSNLDVEGSLGVEGDTYISGHLQARSSSGVAIFGKDESTNNFGYLGGTYGVVGRNPSTDTEGRLGTDDVGVWGEHGSSGNTGELGTSDFGVEGAGGVFGTTDDGVSLYGIAHDDGAGATAVYGLYVNYDGEYTTKGSIGTSDYGVYGSAGGSRYAGYFDGNVHIDGQLSKSSGSFRIDHPLDPKNKYLQHSFVESPDMKNVYDGTVNLDKDGKAVVELPDYFQALNKDFRYQLTPIGAPMSNLYIAQEIKENEFKIAGGEPGKKVSWQVTGVRKDPYAKENRIQVEEEKPKEEKGTYVHPEAYGEDED